MTEKQRELIIALVDDGMDEPDFLKEFDPTRNGQGLTEKLLQDAAKVRDDEVVELALDVAFYFGITIDQLSVLNQLIGETFHTRHEDIVTALESIDHPATVSALYRATRFLPGQIDYVDTTSLAVRAIWALGRIKSDEASNVLEILSKSDNYEIRSSAHHQIQRRLKGVCD